MRPTKTALSPAAARTGAVDEAFEAVLRRDDAALSEVAEEWDDLYRRSPHATPFQTWAWVHSWWRQFGTSGDLRLALVRREGRLVAAAPLMVVRRGGLSVLQPLGSGISDWTDILLDPAAIDPSIGRLRDALLHDTGWHTADFPEVSPDAAVRHLFAGWSGFRRSVAASVCSELAAAPIEELVASLSRTNRANARRALRKIDSAGLTSTVVPVADLPGAVQRLLEIHLRQWQQRGGVIPEHKRPRFARHLTTAAQEMVPRGQAALYEFRLDGCLKASSLFIIGQDVVGGYLYGVEPELYQHVNVTTMMMRTAMEVADQHGCTTFSLMRGREDYKSEWRPVSTRNDRLLMCRPRSLGGHLYVRSLQGIEGVLDTVRRRAPKMGSAARRVHHSLRNPRLGARTVSTAGLQALSRLRRRA